jgi:uncharacterized protein (UPF0147 family)
VEEALIGRVKDFNASSIHHIDMSYSNTKPDSNRDDKPSQHRERKLSRQQMKEQKMVQNQERLIRSTETLETIKKDIQIPKRIKRLINEANLMLKDENNGSLSVRAANAISIMEELTYSRHVQSHVRTKIWDVVSSLEAIRE